MRRLSLSRSLLVWILVYVTPALTQTASPVLPVAGKVPQSTLGPARHSPAPDFTLKSVTGETVRLSDLRGKIVLLNFWATWCAPCKILIPWFVDLQSEYGPRGLQIVGVALDQDATRAEIGEFADNLRVNYPVLIGNEKVGKAYGGLPALPASFFVGRDGNIVDTVIGIKGKVDFEEAIKRALEAQAGINPVAAPAAAPPQK